MAKVFNSTEEIRNYVLSRMDVAVKRVQEKVYDVCSRFLNMFYGEYNPMVSERTYQVFNSLVKSDVRRSGDTVEAEVYFDLSALSHPRQYIGQDGRTVYANWSESQIMESVMTGATHGGRADGTAVYIESLGMVSPQAIQWLKQELIACGVPVR